MNKVFSVLTFLFSIILIGCDDTLQQPVDISSYEKRVPGGKDTIKRDSVRIKNGVPYQAVLDCLNLTRQQRISIDEVIAISNQCHIDCKKEFNTSIKTLRFEYKAKLDQYKNVEKTDSVKIEITKINSEFHNSSKKLETEYKLKLSECKKNLLSEIEKYLTPEQIILWNRWKIDGKLPCGSIKP